MTFVKRLKKASTEIFQIWVYFEYLIYIYIYQSSRTKNLADCDEGLFTRMGHYLFLSKVVLIPSEKQNICYKVKYRTPIKYDLTVLIETSKSLDDFEATIVNLYL